jgi:hypothetical protein
MDKKKPVALNELIRIIENMKIMVSEESDLQDALNDLFKVLDLKFAREKTIAPGLRPDFMLSGGVAVEVKIQDGLSELTRQVHKYLCESSVSAILIVSNKTRLMRLPKEMRGKPVYVALAGGGLR